MKTIASIIGLFCFSLPAAFAQKKDSFPTYEQIMPKTEDMVDYVSPGGSEVIYVNGELHSHQIYGYAKNSVVYYLNGKKTKDENKVRKIVDANARNIKRITTDEIKKNGTRVIRIDFEKSVEGKSFR